MPFLLARAYFGARTSESNPCAYFAIIVKPPTYFEIAFLYKCRSHHQIIPLTVFRFSFARHKKGSSRLVFLYFAPKLLLDLTKKKSNNKLAKHDPCDFYATTMRKYFLEKVPLVLDNKALFIFQKQHKLLHLLICDH